MLFLALSCQDAAELTKEPDTANGFESKFVGDESCASCHGGIYDSYHRTGMGMSISEFDSSDRIEALPAKAVYDANSNLYYQAFLENGELGISEYRLDLEGQKEFERSEFVDFVIGSGNATRSYLRMENGLMTEMPLTWYVDKQIWDLSPGYSQNNFRYDRPIDLECLSCHSGPVERSTFTDNHFAEAPEAIGCEKCHGPGQQHVENQLAGLTKNEEEEDNLAIINPSKLDRTRQMAVCQQCHLTGVSVYKDGESHASFRPGQEVSENRNVLASEEQILDPSKFGISSHAERLEKSACFELSEMTCITCHNPHVPVRELGKDWFNSNCQSCHSDDGQYMAKNLTLCDDPAGQVASANCVSCHMQKSGTSDIPHVTFTDHWIRKVLPTPSATKSQEFVLIKDQPDRLLSISGSESNKIDRALAYFQYYKTRHELRAYTDSVINLLEGQNLRADSYLALAESHFDQGKIEEAVAIIEEGRGKFPQDAKVAFRSGIIAKESGDQGKAIRELRVAHSIQPNEPSFRAFLGQILVASPELKDQNDGIEVLENLRTTYPTYSSSALNNLGLAYLKQNQIEKAKGPLNEAAYLDPDLVEARVSLTAIALQEGNLEKAIELGEQALRIDEKSVGALGNLATAYLSQGDLINARKRIEALLRLSPNNPRALQILSEIERRS